MRRKRIPTFDEYLYNVCTTLHQLGGSVDLLVTRGARTGDDIVILDALVSFPDELELKVLEVIEKTTEGHPHRAKYSYQARSHERLVLRYDREPIRHPEMPEHRHLPGGSRELSESIRLLDFVEKMWLELERRREIEVVPPAAEAEVDVA